MELIYLYLLPVTVALAWLLVFMVDGRSKQLNDRILIAFLAVGGLTIFVSQRFILDGASDSFYTFFVSLEMLLELSVCPLLYLYIRSVTKDTHWHNRYLWLFSPAALFCFSGFLISSLDIFYIAVEAMTVVLMAISIYDLVKYHKSSEDYFANLEESSTDKMRNVLVCAILLLLSMFLLSSFAQDLSSDDEELLIIRSIWFSAMLWLIASNAHKIVLTEKQLEVIALDDDENENENEDEDEDDNADGDVEMAEKIAMWKENPDKPYCQEGITIVEMADQIGVSPRALSSYINNGMGMNFNRWINSLRIEEAKRLLSTQPDQKLSYISILCGYPTPSTFTRAFRQIEGQSPQEYKIYLVRG